MLDADNTVAGTPLVRGKGVTVRYGRGFSTCVAVDRVDIDLARGRTMGLVGESGCGKTTLGRALLRLVPVASGQVTFDGIDVGRLRGRELRAMRRRMQMVFQDASGSLNPRMRVEAILADPLLAHRLIERRWRRDRVNHLLDTVGLPAPVAARYPHEMSGGQRQRVGLARALALGPEFIVCDEPLSALDVTAQAELLDLLDRVKRGSGAAFLFITHNLALARRFCDDVAVMYQGRIVEIGLADAVMSRPAHPYTIALRSETPSLKPSRCVPSACEISPSLPRRRKRGGCSFRDRCPFATDLCAAEEPALRVLEGDPGGHRVACHHADSVREQADKSPTDSHRI